MNSKPLVSVIMPFLNTPEQFMQEAIESVFGQSYGNWELLLVDDGSTDESTGFARRYADKYPEKVRYFEHEGHQNRGASASRNLGISHAKGEYIALLDADDVWLPRKLEEQVAILGAHPEAGMLYGNTQYWYSWTGNPEDLNRDFLPELGVQPDTLVEPPKLLPLFLRGKAAVPCTCSILVRREVIEDIGGFDDAFRSLYTDQVFYAKLCLAASAFVVGTCWDRYRQRPDSSCSVGEKTGRLRSARLAFLNWLAEYLSEQEIKDPELWQALQRELRRYDDSTWLGLRQRADYIERRARKLLLRLRI